MAKKDKKSAKKSKNSAGPKDDSDFIDPATKAIFKVQVKDLEEKIERSESKCKSLELENSKILEDTSNLEHSMRENFDVYQKIYDESSEVILGLKGSFFIGFI